MAYGIDEVMQAMQAITDANKRMRSSVNAMNSTHKQAVEAAYARADQLAKQAAAEYARATQLKNLPPEPEVGYIRFTKKFGPSGRVYIYAACRSSDGFWYTTGPNGGNTPRTWENLVVWIYNQPPEVDVEKVIEVPRRWRSWTKDSE